MMWLFSVLPAAAIAMSSGNQLATGDHLPQLRGEFLNGRTAELPAAAGGRPALLMMGFTYQARFPVEAWAGRFRAQYHQDPRVTFFEIPMIGGLARLGKWFIDSGMRRGTPKADYEHVITVYSGTADWKKRVDFADPDTAYLILLDGQGRVAWQHAGSCEPAAFQDLQSAIAQLLEAR